jgi:hypothetical protein
MTTRHLLALLTLAALAGMAHADGDSSPEDKAPFKFTAGYYQYHDDEGKDVNIRWQHGDTHAWVGHYEDGTFGKQDRIGIDTSIDVTDMVSIQPSIQAATGDYVGGSLNAQIGHAWYGLLGFGRTNLKPYFNLNFDPNDAITLGGGHQFDNGQNWSLFVIHDDRLHTGQTDWHLTARIPVDVDRLSLDLMRKQGDSDVGYIKAWSLSVTYDFPNWFLRIARDPKQNFSGEDAWRFSGGVRF